MKRAQGPACQKKRKSFVKSLLHNEQFGPWDGKKFKQTNEPRSARSGGALGKEKKGNARGKTIVHCLLLRANSIQCRGGGRENRMFVCFVIGDTIV